MSSVCSIDWRRDVEGLQHERAHHDRDEDRHAQQDRQLAPERCRGASRSARQSRSGAYVAGPANVRPGTRRIAPKSTGMARQCRQSRRPVACRTGRSARTGRRRGRGRGRHVVERRRHGQAVPTGSLGQTITNARPITLSIGTGPWQRESCETSAVVAHHEHLPGRHDHLVERAATGTRRAFGGSVERRVPRGTYGSSSALAVDRAPGPARRSTPPCRRAGR